MKSVRYNKDHIIEVIKNLGINGGDNIFIHSSMYRLGFPSDSTKCIKWWLNSLIDKVGSEGTIGVPTFNFNFCKGKLFCKESTESSLGVFSEAFRNDSRSLRTMDPVNSCAFIGKNAKLLSNISSKNAYYKDGIFQAMLNDNFKILLLGAPFQSISFVHLAEIIANVPYRYFKTFDGLCREKRNTDSSNTSYDLYVRDLELNPKLKLENVKRYMLKKNPEDIKSWNSYCIKNIEVLESKKFLRSCLDMLSRDKNSLLED